MWRSSGSVTLDHFRSMRPDPVHGIKAFAQQLEHQSTFIGQVWPIFRKAIKDVRTAVTN